MAALRSICLRLQRVLRMGVVWETAYSCENCRLRGKWSGILKSVIPVVLFCRLCSHTPTTEGVGGFLQEISPWALGPCPWKRAHNSVPDSISESSVRPNGTPVTAIHLLRFGFQLNVGTSSNKSVLASELFWGLRPNIVSWQQTARICL